MVSESLVPVPVGLISKCFLRLLTERLKSTQNCKKSSLWGSRELPENSPSPPGASSKRNHTTVCSGLRNEIIRMYDLAVETKSYECMSWPSKRKPTNIWFGFRNEIIRMYVVAFESKSYECVIWPSCMIWPSNWNNTNVWFGCRNVILRVSDLA